MKRVILTLALVILGCTSSSNSPQIVDTPYAGSDGAVRGVVVEPGGNPLPGVTLVLHTSRGNLTTVSDAKGAYAFLGVAPGRWRLEAILPGFSTQRRSVDVKSGVASGVTMMMRIGSVAESITVTAEAPSNSPGQYVFRAPEAPASRVDYDAAFITNAIQEVPQTAYYAPIAENDYID